MRSSTSPSIKTSKIGCMPLSKRLRRHMRPSNVYSTLKLCRRISMNIIIKSNWRRGKLYLPFYCRVIIRSCRLLVQRCWGLLLTPHRWIILNMIWRAILKQIYKWSWLRNFSWIRFGWDCFIVLELMYSFWRSIFVKRKASFSFRYHT